MAALPNPFPQLVRAEAQIGGSGTPLYELLQMICRLLQKKVIIPPGGASNVVVYREGIPAQIGNIYPTWASAYAAASSLGEFCLFIIDNSLGQPVVTAGSYDISQMILSGYKLAANPIVVDVLDGAVFTGIGTVTQQVVLNSKSTQPVYTAPVGPVQSFLYTSKGAGFATDATAGAPFFHVPATAQLIVVGDVGGGLKFNGKPVVQLDANGFVVFLAGETSSVDNNVFVGAGQAVMNVISTSANIGRTQGLVPASNFILQRQDVAELLSVDPASQSFLWNQPSWLAGAQPEAQTAFQNLIQRETDFVLAPGQTAGGQVFSDLQSLCNAASQARPGPRRIWCDFSLAPTPGQYDAPPGNYNTGGTTTMIGTAVYGLGEMRLNLFDNAFLQNFFDFQDVRVIGNASVVGHEPIVVSGFTDHFSFAGESNNCGLQSNTPFGVIKATQNANVRVVLRGHATLLSAGGPCLVADTGATLDIEAYDQASIQKNTLSYDNTASGTLSLGDGASLDYAQAFIPGGQILAGAVPAFRVDGTFYQTFTNAIGPVFNFTHNLSSPFVTVTVRDQTAKTIIPDSVMVQNQNNISVDLTTYGAFAGTWTVIVRR